MNDLDAVRAELDALKNVDWEGSYREACERISEIAIERDIARRKLKRAKRQRDEARAALDAEWNAAIDAAMKGLRRHGEPWSAAAISSLKRPVLAAEPAPCVHEWTGQIDQDACVIWKCAKCKAVKP